MIISAYKKSFTKGFTLIELLVVIAIIGLLSTIIAAPITQARKKGRDGKKVADMRQITAALQQYADDNAGSFPPNISSLTPKYISNIPPNALNTTLPKDKYMYVAYTDIISVTATSNIGFHLGTKLEATSLSLGDDRDCYSIGNISSSNSTSTWCYDARYFTGTASSSLGNLSPTGFANYPGNSGPAVEYPQYTTQAASATSTDFSGGRDTNTSNCDSALNGSTACIYDLTN